MGKCEEAKSTVPVDTSCKRKEMIENLKAALGPELPTATALLNLQTNSVFSEVFSEPGP